MPESAPDPLPISVGSDRRLDAVRPDDPEALGRLLEACRPYLLLVANQELQSGLQGKVGASDVVQETFLEALRDFQRFEGSTEEELRAWLRRILLHNLGDLTRRYAETAKRDVAREVPIAAPSPGGPEPGLVSPAESPSKQAAAHEQDEALRRALEQLPEEARQVIQWRNYDRCSFDEIGQRLGRSPEAARKVW